MQSRERPLSSSSRAKIAVVKDKHVLEEGSHAELVAKRGLYYEMLNTGTGDDHDDEIELP